MNILVIGSIYQDAFASHISDTLEDMGHSVFNFENSITFKSQNSKFGSTIKRIKNTLFSVTDNISLIRQKRFDKLWSDIEGLSIDLTIVCHDLLWPKEVAKIKTSTKSPVIMWYPDAIVMIAKAYFLNAEYDALFFKDPYIVKMLENIVTTPVFYMPECFNPKSHWHPEEQNSNTLDYSCDISVAGNVHPYRVAFFNNLTEYDVKIWGELPPKWLNTPKINKFIQGKPVFNHEKVDAFRASKIVLNNLHFAEVGVNARCFEVAGAGAFQMMDWRPGIENLFRDNFEIVTFFGSKDLKNKINYWLPRNDERNEIASNGMKRAHQEHTYRHRLKLIIETIFKASKGYDIPKKLTIGHMKGN